MRLQMPIPLQRLHSKVIQNTFVAALVFFLLMLIMGTLILSTSSLSSEDTDQDGRIDFTELRLKLKKPTMDPRTWWNYALTIPIIVYVSILVKDIRKKDKTTEE